MYQYPGFFILWRRDRVPPRLPLFRDNNGARPSWRETLKNNLNQRSTICLGFPSLVSRDEEEFCDDSVYATPLKQVVVSSVRVSTCRLVHLLNNEKEKRFGGRWRLVSETHFFKGRSRITITQNLSLVKQRDRNGRQHCRTNSMKEVCKDRPMRSNNPNT